MNYELAKKLKEAGFKQSGKGKVWYTSSEDREQYFFDGEFEIRPVYIPTLSELIEACGEEDLILKCIVKENWTAEKLTGEYGIGNTAEEAVANLWLELNKK